VQFEITPEPTPEERAALEQALAASVAGHENGASAWWEAGLRESVEEEPEEA
jgi:hypothetical protein